MDNRDYIQFGDLRLAVMGGLYAFSGDKGYDYADYDLATGKPMKAAVGEKLRTLSLSIMLRHYLGDDIKGTIEIVDDMIASGDAFDLIFVDGLYKGKYLITSVKDKIEKTLPNGTIYEFDMTMDLVEYANREVLSSTPNVQKQSPKKIARKKAVNKSKPKVTEPQKKAAVNTKVVQRQSISGDYSRGTSLK